MKTGHFIILTVLIVYSVQVSHQSASQETALASSQSWSDENQPEEYREDDKTEEETIRRPRGKRRRRLRKKQRDHQLEEVDRINDPDNIQDHYNERSETEDDAVIPVEYPRRRPGKRRRRPYRRYQDDENGPPKPLRRRRKGGRRKIRPEIHEEVTQTEAIQEFRNEDNYETETTTFIVPKLVPNINENLTEEKPLPTEANEDVYQPTNQPQAKDFQEGKLISNAVKTDNEDINIDKATNYDNKVFDRKKLFSNSRRMLPVTSAVIRRLSPGAKINATDIPLGKSKAEQIEQLKAKIDNITERNKLMIKTNLLPENYVIPTEVIKTEQIAEDVRKRVKGKKQNDNDENDTIEEEPNYPKILPKIILSKNKEDEITTKAALEINEESQTEKPTIKPELEHNKSMEEEFQDMLDNLDLKSFNITNFNDYILEVLKTKSGKEYLSKILESRNMTLAQLLEHRERGSSQFHLFEIFPQKKTVEESSTKVSVSVSKSTITTSTSTGTPETKEKSKILFPSEEVMKSFPQFVASEVEKQENKFEKELSHETTSTGAKENREPRLFESMPEFTTTNAIAIKEEKPVWRVIPNPKFRPVSIRGNYEEIPVSHILNKPIENSINDVYSVDDNETQIYKKYGLLSSDGTKRDSFGSFRKMPVGVKSAIIISGIILAMATFGFLSLLISCRVRQKRSILKAKQDLMCEHLQNEDFMASQQSLSPVLTKHQQVYSSHEPHSNPNNRHYYLWRTLRRTFRYD